jgi:hypothetical protein
MLSGAVITGRRVATPVVCAQTAATMSAAGETLEQCAAFRSVDSRLCSTCAELDWRR